MSEEGYVPGGYGIGVDVKPHGSIGRHVMYLLPKNPNDRSTIVSIIPKDIKEVKHTIFPSEYKIPAAPSGDFSIRVIGAASWFMANQNEKLPPIEVQVNSWQLAEAICLDYNAGIYMSNMHDSMPGLFCIPGEWDKNSILKFVDKRTGKEFPMMLNEARVKQRNWFRALVEASDADWANTSGNPRAITDYARIAARELKLDKPWNKDFEAIQMSNCPYCGELINPKFPICRHCSRVINPNQMATLDQMFAGMEKK